MTIDYYFGRFSPFLCLLEFDDLKRGALAKPRFQTHTLTSIHPILDLEGVRDCRQLFSNYFLLWGCQKKILVLNLPFGWLQKCGDKKGGHAKSYFQTERAKNFVQVLAQKFKALGKRVTNQMRRQILTPFMAFDDHFKWAFAKLMMIEQKFHTSMPHT